MAGAHVQASEKPCRDRGACAWRWSPPEGLIWQPRKGPDVAGGMANLQRSKSTPGPRPDTKA